jgi:DNA-binding NtrC family response regulator
VLIVDDERNIQVTLARALSLEGYATYTAGTGQEALEKIASLPVDLVLLDVKLPDLDGLAVLEKALQTRPGLPVVVMSGHGSIETVRQALLTAAGAVVDETTARRTALAVEPEITEWAGMAPGLCGTP